MTRSVRRISQMTADESHSCSYEKATIQRQLRMQRPRCQNAIRREDEPAVDGWQEGVHQEQCGLEEVDEAPDRKGVA